MKQVSENYARFKIAEEKSWVNGGTIYWVYRKRGTTGWFGKPDWSPDKFFANFKDAEAYVQESLDFREAVNNPKMVKYYA